MHHWPITFSLIGFVSILSVVGLFFLYRLLKQATTTDVSYSEYGDLSDNSSSGEEEDEKEDIVETVYERGDDKNSSDDSEVIQNHRKSSNEFRRRIPRNESGTLSTATDSNYDTRTD